jgi:hypothetical protein
MMMKVVVVVEKMLSDPHSVDFLFGATGVWNISSHVDIEYSPITMIDHGYGILSALVGLGLYKDCT